MAERIRARALLRRAEEVYDSPTANLSGSATAAWRTGFASGGLWMGLALAEVRGAAPVGSRHDLQVLGLVKYGLAATAGLACMALAWLLEEPLALLLCVPAFYAVEAQMVFLFPLALDGSVRPFREARWWTRRAGGTLAVMVVVLPIAGTMLFGGFLGRGFVRSWCVGCLAVCIWYEDLRSIAELTPTSALAEMR
jgi:hypothetical protein